MPKNKKTISKFSGCLAIACLVLKCISAGLPKNIKYCLQTCIREKCNQSTLHKTRVVWPT